MPPVTIVALLAGLALNQPAPPSATPGGIPAWMWDVLKIGVPVALTYWGATVRAKRKAEQEVDRHGVAAAVDRAVKAVETDIGSRVDRLQQSVEAMHRDSDRRFARVEFVVWGVDERGGLRAEASRLEKKMDEDHKLLTSLDYVVRELYRRMTQEEPPHRTPDPEPYR